MKTFTNARLISLTLVLVLLAPAQQVSNSDRSQQPAARPPEPRQRRSAPRSRGSALQVTTPLPGQSTTQLPDGSVLALGGNSVSGVVSRASLNGILLSATLQDPRAWHTTTVLPDGTVFIFGGIDAKGLASDAELYYPAARTFTPASNVNLSPRAYHTTTLLTDGTILIAGGVAKNGKVLDRLEIWDGKSKSSQTLPAHLMQARKGHTATLQADGTVRIAGGVLDDGSPASSVETYNPATGSVMPGNSVPQPATQLQVAASIPADGSLGVSTGSLISLRFSRPLDLKSVNNAMVTVRDQNGPLAAKIIGAEAGMLAFVVIDGGLQLDSTYTVSVHGAMDKNGFSIQPSDFSFSTQSSGLDNSANGSTSGSQDDPPVPPLQAGPGVTALSGSVRTVSGKYLQGVSLVLDCGETKGKQNKAVSDGTGRFLIAKVPSGHCELEIDGTTVRRGSDVYGIFTPGVDITAGRTNVLPYTIWMTPLDVAHTVRVPSPTSSEFIVKYPNIPDLELHLPSGAVIKDYDGNIINQLTITRIPLGRPPFPLPGGVSVPFYFTIQPGGAYIEVNGAPSGATLYYPNQNRAPAGFKMDFWNYDPEGKGWYIYGRGTVDASRRFIVPDPGTKIYSFTGAMVGSSGNGGSGGAGTGGSGGGDPVDLGTGILTHQRTDLYLPDVLPVALTRTYRQWDSSISHAFGVGMSHNLDVFIVGDVFPYTYLDLIRADGSRVHFTRTSSGTSYTDAVYQAQSDPDFLGAQIVYINPGWSLTFKNGTVWTFPDSYLATIPEQGSIIGVRDRHGNTINMARDASTGRLLKVTSQNGKWISFTYDISSRVTRATDNSGRSVSYQYDAAGRLVTVTNPAGNTNLYTYDANNHILTLQDNRGIVYLTNQYDSSGRVSQQTTADGGVWQYAYTLDGSGNIVQTDVTDPRSKVRRVTFNTSSYFGGGKTTGETFAYGTGDAQAYTRSLQSGTNLLLNVTDALSHVTSFTYDSKGNLLTLTRAYGTGSAATTTYTYDTTFSQVTSIADPLSHTTSFTLNSTGDATTVTDPLSHQFTFTYNSSGQPLTATNSAGTTTFTYNAGLLATVTDPLGDTFTTSYDSLGRLVGRLVGATDALGNSTSYDYDAVNDLLHVTDPLNARTSFTYDANGNLLSLVDALGNATTYSYNNMEERASRTDPLTHAESYSYDLNGNLSTRTDRKSQATGYSYDGLNRLSQVTFADSSTTSNTYDAANRLTQVVDSVSGTITRTYDILDRLTNETTPQGSVTYTYDAANRRASMTVYGQSAVNYDWDNANRLTQISQGSATVSLGYDSANRRTSLTLPNGVSAAYGYDTASRLTGLTYTKGGTTIGTLTYGYDATGRVTSKGGTLASTGLPSSVTSATYNANNELTNWSGTTLSYDLNGNMTSDGTTTHTWNARNQLSAFGGTSFAYDSFGRRIQNAAGNAFLYDGVDAVQELSGGTVTANLLTGLGTDEVFTRTDSVGERGLLIDLLGSTIALADSSGTVQTQYSYEPFGKTTATGASNSSTFQYTGRENDGTGLYFNRARYYNPMLGRFISEDPVGFVGGINFYIYAASSPLSFLDPFGLLTWPVSAGPQTVVNGFGSNHNGIDIPNPVGSPVNAPESGTIRIVPNTTYGGGNEIFITTPSGQTWGFAHTTAPTTVVNGQQVNEGAQIGVTDLSGHTTGGHAHVTYRPCDGCPWIDPLTPFDPPPFIGPLPPYGPPLPPGYQWPPINRLHRGLTRIAFAIGVGVVLAGGAPFGLHAQQSTRTSNDAIQQLHQIGATARDAVLKRDLSRLLQFERSSNRTYDEGFLANKKGAYYCYLFDTSCIPKGMIRRSVFDILLNMRTPAIIALLSSSDQPLHGKLYFYDRSQISETTLRRSLQSRKFRCERVPNVMAFWEFEFVNDQWLTRDLFDYATDTLCSPGMVFK